jgi:hypothetical protein
MPAPKFTPKDVGLTSTSFVSITSSEVTRRAILNVEAEQKAGKTDFSVRTLPDPIVIFNFDQGLEHVVEKQVKKGKRIIVAGSHKQPKAKYPSYHFAKPAPDKGEKQKSQTYLDRIKALAYPIWNKFITDYTEALESPHIRTLVIDTGGAAFQLGKFAFMGMDKYTSKDDPYGQKGGEMKSIFQGLITDAYNYSANVLWLHRLKEEWVGGQPAGTYKVEGYAGMPYEVQSTIRLRNVGKGEKLRRVGEIRFNRIGQGSSQNGMKFGEDGGLPLDFGTILGTLTGTDFEEWE